MECTQCHQHKVPYEFAVVKRQPLICFDCIASYTCCICEQVYPSTHYRIQGRMCVECRNNRSDVRAGKIARAYVRTLEAVQNAQTAHSEEKRVA